MNHTALIAASMVLLLAPLARLNAGEIILAGGDEVFIVDAAEAAAGIPPSLLSAALHTARSTLSR